MVSTFYCGVSSSLQGLFRTNLRVWRPCKASTAPRISSGVSDGSSVGLAGKCGEFLCACVVVSNMRHSSAFGTLWDWLFGRELISRRFSAGSTRWALVLQTFNSSETCVAYVAALIIYSPGTIPPTIGRLTGLTYLNLFGNDLSGEWISDAFLFHGKLKIQHQLGVQQDTCVSPFSTRRVRQQPCSLSSIGRNCVAEFPWNWPAQFRIVPRIRFVCGFVPLTSFQAPSRKNSVSGRLCLPWENCRPMTSKPLMVSGWVAFFFVLRFKR